MEKNLKQFSPVTGSPVIKGKALTGIPLIVRDSVIEVHTNIQKWNAIHLKGIPIVQSIIDLKNDESYPAELITLCSSLEKICDEIDAVVCNLKILFHKFQKLQSLNENRIILFSTWSIEKFANTVETVYTSYKNEAKTKRIIVENIAHEFGDAAKMVYFASWVYQPQIADNLKFQIEMMLIETGLRKI
ncbi:cyclin-dependent kinase 2-interacting protein isoform X2 [Leptopilina boulardi]|uniref:cyclin-dependent kinase 2-interacting protein isoform X2 n=1 Tax=Leptopilina boulardi TaxID=63433 RepID=UPI0021F555DA|nr:cyclin-dependent kinase 2-interacting protein isoform X2 [Leptopilina boulardi]